MLSVQELRKQGFKVGITHFRHYHDGESYLFARQKDAEKVWEKPYTHLKANGGLTEVTVTTPEGRTIKTDAQCAESDQFNKRLGVRIALGRALKELGFQAK